MRARSARGALVAALVAAGALAALPGSASAGYCNDEGALVAGGEEVSVSVGPGGALVGADVGGIKGTDEENFVCVESPPASVNTYVKFDSSPGTPGATLGGCAVDVLGSGCDVPGVRVGFSDPDAQPVLEVNGFQALPDGCVLAVGASCP